MDKMETKGSIFIVGIGPGSEELMTKQAQLAINKSEIIVGYRTYIDLILPYIKGKEVVATGMTKEIERAEIAIDLAKKGKKVAVISSGDAGVYGMAGLIYEMIAARERKISVQIEVIPGISAVNAAAALLGAPLMNDYCTISLSDLLTPWEQIEKRIRLAAEADFVIALYNPKSKKRILPIQKTQEILLQYRSADTPVGIVKNAYRDDQEVIVTTLGEMLHHEMNMVTTIIVGNQATFQFDQKIVTPRGYQNKYSLTER
ncbi:precorrin-3B C(17)-methyltransferase [Tepidibacillus sp. LV47]|uniref:precorrin-3B C(17)-methyltransferase n=1 Tax=Tepidibacillus sp. LV47 TaxID=3398228 RepID=UPI003AAC5D27